jgi:outer membrane protein assembly factor BamB
LAALLLICLPVVAQTGAADVLWTKKVGAGFAGPVVAEGKLLLFHRVGNAEVLDALDPGSGKPVWHYEAPSSYRDDFGFDEGPRSAPAVAAGRVFTYGAEGRLSAVELGTGRKLWSVDVMKQYAVEKGFFGAAGTPLVYENRVLVNAGGKNGAGIVAFDAATGRELWKATNDEASYSSGMVAVLHGRTLALFFTRNGLVALDPLNGSVMQQFRHRSRSRASVNAATALAWNNQVFLSASYATGAILLEAQPSGPWKTIWTNDDSLSSHYSTSVRVGEHLYGFHGRQEEGQELRCAEWKTGKVMWAQEGFGAGTVLLAGNQLVIMKERGEVVVAEASPRGFQPKSTSKLLAGVVRAYPALADGRIFVRNGDTLVAARLR